MPTSACGLNYDKLDSCWRRASALPEDALRCLRQHIHQLPVSTAPPRQADTDVCFPSFKGIPELHTQPPTQTHAHAHMKPTIWPRLADHAAAASSGLTTQPASCHSASSTNGVSTGGIPLFFFQWGNKQPDRSVELYGKKIETVQWNAVQHSITAFCEAGVLV